MAKQGIELDVDHIGTQDSTLTKKEEKAISEYIRARRAKKRSKTSKERIKA